MKLRIICIGKLKEQGTKDWLAEFDKRLTKYADVEWIELKESTPSDEAKEILKKVKDSDFCVVLDKGGKTLASETFADFIRKQTMQKDICFVIGGPFGITDDLKKRANLVLSFGPMTFSHQIARIVLAEQIYRAFTIIKGEPYHK
jgi:23S rRNA (pseudouridine1915-N3)-methyltransferase